MGVPKNFIQVMGDLLALWNPWWHRAAELSTSLYLEMSMRTALQQGPKKGAGESHDFPPMGYVYVYIYMVIKQ